MPLVSLGCHMAEKWSGCTETRCENTVRRGSSHSAEGLMCREARRPMWLDEDTGQSSRVLSVCGMEMMVGYRSVLLRQHARKPFSGGGSTLKSIQLSHGSCLDTLNKRTQERKPHQMRLWHITIFLSRKLYFLYCVQSQFFYIFD